MKPTQMKTAKRTALLLSAICVTCTGCWNSGLPAQAPGPLTIANMTFPPEAAQQKAP